MNEDYVIRDARCNPSYVLAYTGDNLTSVTMTVAGTVYEKTLTWTGDDLTAVSAWVEQ